MKMKTLTEKAFAGYERPLVEFTDLDLDGPVMVGSIVDGAEKYDDQVIDVEDLFQ